MLAYMVYDKKTGNIVHLHHAVDAEGRTTRCTDGEVIAALPDGLNADDVGIAVTELDELPSGREVSFRVEVSSGKLVKSAVKAPAKRRPSKSGS